MRIDIISAVPELLTSPFSHSILKRAEERGLLFVKVHDLRAYGVGKNRQIDDYQYGGGAGMVMMCEPIDNLISELKADRDYDDIIYMTPDGATFQQAMANQLSLIGRLIPGVLNDEASALLDTFQDDLLAPPIYTRPSTFKGHKVPDVLLSGNDARIDEWRTEMSIARTKERRPDLFQKLDPS